MPLDTQSLVLDFAVELKFPVVVVCRAGLGTINHTLLTLREVQRCGLEIAALIMNVTSPPDADLAAGARAEIERWSGVPVTACLPFFSGPAGCDLSIQAARALSKVVT